MEIISHQCLLLKWCFSTFFQRIEENRCHSKLQILYNSITEFRPQNICFALNHWVLLTSCLDSPCQHSPILIQYQFWLKNIITHQQFFILILLRRTIRHCSSFQTPSKLVHCYSGDPLEIISFIRIECCIRVFLLINSQRFRVKRESHFV